MQGTYGPETYISHVEKKDTNSVYDSQCGSAYQGNRKVSQTEVKAKSRIELCKEVCTFACSSAAHALHSEASFSLSICKSSYVVSGQKTGILHLFYRSETFCSTCSAHACGQVPMSSACVSCIHASISNSTRKTSHLCSTARGTLNETCRAQNGSRTSRHKSLFTVRTSHSSFLSEWH